MKLASRCCLAFSASTRPCVSLAIKLSTFGRLFFHVCFLALNTLSELLRITLVFFTFFLTQSGLELVPETRNADVPKQFSNFSLRNFIASVLFFCLSEAFFTDISRPCAYTRHMIYRYF